MRRGLLAAVGLVVLTLPTRADIVSDIFGDCGEPCVIRESGGGFVPLFMKAREQVIIDGACASACVLFADYARSKICVTPWAVFGFHKGTHYNLATLSYGLPSSTLRFDPPHSGDIDGWVKVRGGYPYDGILWMSATEAVRFWRPCPLPFPLRPWPLKPLPGQDR
jgi:hypothetical protein